MRKLLMLLLSLTVTGSVTACSPADPPPRRTTAQESGGNENPGTDPADPDNMNIVIRIGPYDFTATLTDNSTAMAFKALLPMTADMRELNRNEKYYDLTDALPTAAFNPATIRSGDLMLYGSGTLVLFYKTFPTSYSYTRIGAVDDPAGLERALGSGAVTVSFEPSGRK